MGRFILAHILDKYELGDKFTLWPLHATILPPFSAASLGQVTNSLRPVVSRFEPVKVEQGEQRQFGKQAVRMLRRSEQLHNLHKSCLLTAEAKGWEMAGRYTGSGYTPHITRKAGRDFAEDVFVIDRLAVVESLPMGYRQIVAELPIGVE